MVHWVMSGVMILETMKWSTIVSWLVVGRCGERGGCIFLFSYEGSLEEGRKRSFAMMRVW